MYTKFILTHFELEWEDSCYDMYGSVHKRYFAMYCDVTEFLWELVEDMVD